MKILDRDANVTDLPYYRCKMIRPCLPPADVCATSCFTVPRPCRTPGPETAGKHRRDNKTKFDGRCNRFLVFLSKSLFLNIIFPHFQNNLFIVNTGK